MSAKKKTMRSLVISVATAAPPPPPPGFKTINQWIKEIPEFAVLSHAQARIRLSEIIKGLVAKGQVEVKKFPARVGDFYRATNHYRVIE